ncbi:MAG: AAA family ATPase, partial [Solirubrobacteraceae bacterium]
MSIHVAEMVAPALPVIESKLMLPRLHAGTLRRARLLELLDHVDGAALTVLDAPVGYGKTTLLRSWCAERAEPVIWMTLDESDNDPARLWTHLATGVARLGDGLAHRTLTRVGAQPAAVETAVDELMNRLVAYDRPATIVLDDLHTVRSETSLRSIEHAIERLPPTVRLVAATRSEPAISIAPLRATRALIEIRARELAFTVDEARELIAREGIKLSGDSLELLVERTEGWPAGLYLAALWLRDFAEPDEGVEAFAGSARQVADYLTAEVLTALDPRTRDFLVRTSVLDRFTPELCDAVVDREDSAAVVAQLARSNMFLVASDPRGEWYRYHHLFGELLRLELGTEETHTVRRRAMAWCRAHGHIEDAIEYAAAAGEAELVAQLLVEHDRELVWG